MPSLSKGYAQPLVTPNPFPGSVPQQGGPYFCAGAPLNGTNCVQTVTIGGTPTGGTFTLSFGGLTTGTIAWTATDATLASNIANALAALPNVGSSGVTGAVGTGSSGIGTYTVTFSAQNQGLPVPLMTVGANSMTGTSPTVAVAMTTTGVAGTLRGSYAGTILCDYTGPRQWSDVTGGVQQSYVRSDRYCAVFPLTATSSTSGGGLGAWAPAEGGPVWVERLVVQTTTQSTGAANLSAGVAANKTTSASNLIAATAVGSATKMIDSFTTQIIAATAAESGIANLIQLMSASQFVTFTGSADTTGLVAVAYIYYFKP